MSESTNSSFTFVRTRLNHNSWMRPMLMKTSSQYDHPYGPNMRFHIMNRSNGDALYHAKNASIV